MTKEELRALHVAIGCVAGDKELDYVTKAQTLRILENVEREVSKWHEEQEGIKC